MEHEKTLAVRGIESATHGIPAEKSGARTVLTFICLQNGGDRSGETPVSFIFEQTIA